MDERGTLDLDWGSRGPEFKSRQPDHMSDREEEPADPEELVGKDELDEDDEMELSGDDLVEGD